MSKELVFKVYLSPTNGSPVPLQYAKETGRLTLDKTPTSIDVVMVVEGLPRFLADKGALYLGKKYFPKVQIADERYYLIRRNGGSNTYFLSKSLSPRALGFTLLNPQAMWNTDDAITHLRLSNMYLDDITSYRFVRTGASGRLVYSPMSCLLAGDNVCDVCLEGMRSSAGGCVAIQYKGGIPFVAKSGDKVYTYRIKDRRLVVARVPVDIISAEVETNTIMPQRVFYIDVPKVDTPLVYGEGYPVFVVVDNTKMYLENAQASGETIAYTLSPEIGPNTARIRPTSPGVYSDFLDGTIVPISAPIAFQDSKAVEALPVTEAPPEVGVVGPASGATGPVTGAPQGSTNRWWIWALVAVAVVILVVLLIFLLRR